MILQTNIHKAKLEEGSEATAWCLGNTEKASIHESVDDYGRTTNTIASMVQSLISIYEDHKLEIAPTEISWNENKKIMIQRQKRSGSSTVSQTLIGASTINKTVNASLTPAAFISIYTSLDGKTVYINAPGGVYINGTLQE